MIVIIAYLAYITCYWVSDWSKDQEAILNINGQEKEHENISENKLSLMEI